MTWNEYDDPEDAEIAAALMAARIDAWNLKHRIGVTESAPDEPVPTTITTKERDVTQYEESNDTAAAQAAEIAQLQAALDAANAKVDELTGDNRGLPARAPEALTKEQEVNKAYDEADSIEDFEARLVKMGLMDRRHYQGNRR